MSRDRRYTGSLQASQARVINTRKVEDIKKNPRALLIIFQALENEYYEIE